MMRRCNIPLGKPVGVATAGVAHSARKNDLSLHAGAQRFIPRDSQRAFLPVRGVPRAARRPETLWQGDQDSSKRPPPAMFVWAAASALNDNFGTLDLA
jgi:hypothetical protein